MGNPLLAYWDSTCGLVKVRVLSIVAPDFRGSGYDVRVEVTAARRPYKRGERMNLNPRYIWPRDCAKVKRGTYGRKYIVARYDWRERV